MYLIDTDIISLLRRPERHLRIANWFQRRNPEDFFVSVITFGELQRGVDMAERADAVFAQHLRAWLNEVMGRWQGNVIYVDSAIALRWGSVSALIGNKDADLLIAATALERNLAVVTRNVRHFEPTGVRIANPFEA